MLTATMWGVFFGGICLFLYFLRTKNFSVLEFSAAAGVWIVVCLMFIHRTTINEFTVGVFKIKRNVQASQKILKRIENTEKEIQKIYGNIQATQESINRNNANLKVVLEVMSENIILQECTKNKYPTPKPARERIIRNTNTLIRFARADLTYRRKWFKDFSENVLKPSGCEEVIMK